eukprot:9502610-Pyramimonas_sp.AAC.1
MAHVPLVLSASELPMFAPLPERAATLSDCAQTGGCTDCASEAARSIGGGKVSSSLGARIADA